MTKAKRQQRPHRPEAVAVIQSFGGTGKVATLCGVEPASVSGWKANGIPAAREQYLRLLNPAAFNNNAQANEVERLKERNKNSG